MFDESILFALTAMFVYGVTQVLSKYALGSVNAVTMIAVNFLATFPLYLVFLAATLIFVDLDSIPIEYYIYGAVGVGTARGGYYVYMEALEKASVTIVGSITAAYPAITALLAITLLGETIGGINLAGIALIVTSMIAVSFTHKSSSDKSVFSRSALILSIAVLVIWGIGGVFIKAALTEMPLIAYLGLYPFILPPLAFAYLKHRKAGWGVFSLKWSVPIIASVMAAELWQLGYFGETAAISTGAASIVFPIVSAYPVVTMVTAYFTLRERVSGKDWAFLLLVVIGIILASM